jgi:hypothetical protein
LVSASLRPSILRRPNDFFLRYRSENGLVSIAELSQVALGYFLETWGSFGRYDLSKTIEAIVKILEACDKALKAAGAVTVHTDFVEDHVGRLP